MQQTKKIHECLFPDCGKVFKRRDYLIRHASNHSQVKPFPCDTCKVSFARKDLLEKHQKSKSHSAAFLNDSTITFINTGFPKRQKLNASVDDLLDSSSEQRFSNVSNTIEDSFGWLFGNDNVFSDDNNDLHYSTSGTPKNTFRFAEDRDFTPEDQESTTDYGLYQELSDKIIDYLKTELHVQHGKGTDINQLFSKSSMIHFLDLYWKHFNSVYPIIHKSTAFDLTIKESQSELHLNLLLAMISIGMLYSPSYDYTVALSIQKKMRLRLYRALDAFDYTLGTIKLNLLQTLLLNDIFQMYFGDATQLSKFNIYHSVVINTFKELKMFDSLVEPSLSVHELVNGNKLLWREWIRYETLKRLALFSYVLDTQGCFFYGLASSISVFDIQLELPYPDQLWKVDDIKSFTHYYKRLPQHLVSRGLVPEYNNFHKRYDIKELSTMIPGSMMTPNVKPEGKWPNFLFSLKNLLLSPSDRNDTNFEYHFDCFSQFSRFIFLHGVVSLVNELRSSTSTIMADLNDLTFSTNRLNVVAGKIEQAFLCWRKYFHNNIAEANAVSLSGSQLGSLLNIYDTSSMFWANITLLNAGLLGLYCNLELITKYSSLVIKNLTEQNKGNLDYLSPGKIRFDAISNTKTRVLVEFWSKSKDGDYSMAQACSLLKMVFSNEEIITSVPHLPDSVYLAALVCWAYVHSTHSSDINDQQRTNSDIKNEAFKFLDMFSRDMDDSEDFSLKQGVNEEARILLVSLLRYVIKTLQERSNWVTQKSPIIKSLVLLAGSEISK